MQRRKLRAPAKLRAKNNVHTVFKKFLHMSLGIALQCALPKTDFGLKAENHTQSSLARMNTFSEV